MYEKIKQIVEEDIIDANVDLLPHNNNFMKYLEDLE